MYKYREGKVKSTPKGEWNRSETVGLQAVGVLIRQDDGVPIEEWAGELLCVARLRDLEVPEP